jgi:hypothetical protein
VIQGFCQWLSNTTLSMAIQNAFWIVPTVQTVHILAIAVVMSSIMMLNLRLLGLAGRSQPFDDVANRFLPWVWCAVAVLLASGSVLIVAEPGRELLSVVFWLKMSLLATVLLVTAAVQLAHAHSGFWERQRVLATLTAVVSIALWVGVLAAGRWIAYVEHG